MKIGILTLHEADSYGAVLQAYALQQVLTELGAESEFLSFQRKRGGSADSGLAGPLLLRMRRAGEERGAHFAAFRAAHLRCALPCAPADAPALNGLYDRFVVGSDQVWNPHIPGVDERYFLPFAPPEKRFSYAASFGAAALPERLRDWCSGQLSVFRGLSVREESGARLVRELTGREAAVHLDPTLLLEPTRWEALTEPVEGEPYALLFLLKYDAELAARARAAAAERGLALRVCTAAFMPPLGFEAWSGVGVERWLSLIRHAACVLTNSFHGAVFSLLFQRPLFVGLLDGELRDRNGRIEELLRLTGMERCTEALCPAPAPAALAACLAEKREVSLDYLTRMTKDAAV